MKKIGFYIVSLIALVLVSCNKNDDSVPLAERSNALLGQWEYEAIMTDRAVDINGDGTVNIDLFNSQEVDQCIKDNLTFFTEMGFKGKGVYAINENGLACNSENPFLTLEEHAYELVDNSIIRFETRNEMRIQELTKTRLIIETNENLGGEEVITAITFRKSS